MALPFLCQDLLVEATAGLMKDFDQRNCNRFKAISCIALTPNGFCQVVNLSKGGLSLKCFWGLDFPHEFTMDIYDENGLSLHELKVKKVWEKRPSQPGRLLKSELEFGGSFENLSSSQEVHLNSQILKLMAAEKNI